MKPRRAQLFVGMLALLGARVSLAADLTITLPDSTSPKLAAALAPSVSPAEDGLGTPGDITPHSIHFHALATKTPYDLRIRLTTGEVLRGVNMSWYSLEPADPAHQWRWHAGARSRPVAFHGAPKRSRDCRAQSNDEQRPSRRRNSANVALISIHRLYAADSRYPWFHGLSGLGIGLSLSHP